MNGDSPIVLARCCQMIMWIKQSVFKDIKKTIFGLFYLYLQNLNKDIVEENI